MLVVRNDVRMLEILKKHLIKMGKLGQFYKIKEKNKRWNQQAMILRFCHFS
jgi:hypothetical protein